MNRYDQLIDLITMARPQFIVEVGTHRGARAMAMCQAALAHRNDVRYLGFDLFEDATPETDAAEMNGKGPAIVDAAEKKLNLLKKHNPGFTFELVKGNTRQTLHGKNIIADFVFIDGGHSIETIRGDFEALKNSRYIVFDDYYMGGVDTTKFGSNAVLADVPHQVLPVEDTVGDTPHQDGHSDMNRRQRRKAIKDVEAKFEAVRQLSAKYDDSWGRIQTWELWEGRPDHKPADVIMAFGILEHQRNVDDALTAIKSLARVAVMFGIKLDAIRDFETWKRIVEKHFTILDAKQEGPIASIIASPMMKAVPGAKIVAAGTVEGWWDNIVKNSATIKKRVQTAPAHDVRAIIACYGPSLTDHIPRLVEEALEGPSNIISVSGAHDFLIGRGITPHYHVECDPRPHKADNINKPSHRGRIPARLDGASGAGREATGL